MKKLLKKLILFLIPIFIWYIALYFSFLYLCKNMLPMQLIILSAINYSLAFHFLCCFIFLLVSKKYESPPTNFYNLRMYTYLIISLFNFALIIFNIPMYISYFNYWFSFLFVLVLIYNLSNIMLIVHEKLYQIHIIIDLWLMLLY